MYASLNDQNLKADCKFKGQQRRVLTCSDYQVVFSGEHSEHACSVAACNITWVILTTLYTRFSVFKVISFEENSYSDLQGLEHIARRG